MNSKYMRRFVVAGVTIAVVAALAVLFFPLPKSCVAVWYAESQFAQDDLTSLDAYVQSEKIWKDLGDLQRRLGDYETFKHRLSNSPPRVGLFWQWIHGFLEGQILTIADMFIPKGQITTTRRLYIVTDGLTDEVAENLCNRMAGLIYLESARIACENEYPDAFRESLIEAVLVEAEMFVKPDHLALLDRWPTETLHNVFLPVLRDFLLWNRWDGIEREASIRRRAGIEAVERYLEQKLKAG